MAKGRRYISSHFYWLTLILIPKRQKSCILYIDYTSINKKKSSLHRQDIKPWLLEDRKSLVPFSLLLSPTLPFTISISLKLSLKPWWRNSPSLPFPLRVHLSTDPFSPGLALPPLAFHPPLLPAALAQLLSPGKSPLHYCTHWAPHQWPKTVATNVNSQILPALRKEPELITANSSVWGNDRTKAMVIQIWGKWRQRDEVGIRRRSACRILKGLWNDPVWLQKENGNRETLGRPLK